MGLKKDQGAWPLRKTCNALICTPYKSSGYLISTILQCTVFYFGTKKKALHLKCKCLKGAVVFVIKKEKLKFFFLLPSCVFLPGGVPSTPHTARLASGHWVCGACSTTKQLSVTPAGWPTI